MIKKSFPKISVVMSTLNPDSKSLHSAVRSVLQQSFASFEFIIVDDGSTSIKKKEIDSLTKLDDRIKIVHNSKNHGLAYSLNEGIRIATGEYIARMDDDDFSMENRFEIQLQYLQNHPDIDFVGSNVLKFGESGNASDGIIMLPASPTPHDFLWTSPFIHPSVMFRTISLRSVGGYRVSQLTRRTEDYDLFMRMYAKDMKGHNLKQPLLRYFVSVESMKKKRLFRYRIDEMRIRVEGFKQLQLPIYRYIFVLKPIFVGLLPQTLVYYIHSRNSK